MRIIWAFSILLLAVRCVRMREPDLMAEFSKMAEESQTEVLEPCRLHGELLTYVRSTKPVRALSYNIQIINGKTVLVLGFGRQLPLTPLSKMVGGDLGAPVDIDQSVEQYRSYIESGLTLPTFGSKALTPALVPRLSVDNRRSGELIRNQGKRDTCVAHATIAAMERFTSVPDDLSEQDAHHELMLQQSDNCCFDGGVITTDAARYLATHPVPEEGEWRYTPVRPSCRNYATCSGTAHNRPPFAGKTYRIKDATVLVRRSGVASVTNPAYLESLIDVGHDVVLGTFMRPLSKKASKGVLDVVMQGGQPYCPGGGHAVLLVGYDHDKSYFIAKDSRGPKWGQDGYLFLSYDFIRVYAKYGFVINQVEEV